MDKIICKGCGTEFLLLKSNQKYCSPSCRSSAHFQRNKSEIREKNRVKYQTNENGFRDKVEKARVKYRLKIKETNKRYKDKIRFSGNREKALIRDNNECQNCGTTEQLTVHHKDKSGQTDHPNNELDNLITLCASCHQDEHRFDKPNSGQYINCLHCGKELFAKKTEIGRKKYCSRECADKDKIGKLKTSEFRNCLICSKQFMATSQSIQMGKGKYCSHECARIGESKKVTVNCLCCGNEFQTIPAKIKIGKGKYCSRQCYLTANKSKKGAI